ncbi:MAG: hypothetical protein RIS44_1158 [Pseudomonadota bacterium]|jgi:hypothetical protein
MRSRDQVQQLQKTAIPFIFFIWLASSITIFFLLIAIPREMAVGAPIDCLSYALARGGWGCARLGDVASSPWLFLGASVVSCLCTWLTLRLVLLDISFLLAVNLQLAFIVLLSSLTRFVYFLQGHVNSDHARLSLIGAVAVTICLLAVIWRENFHMRQQRAKKESQPDTH